MVLGFGLCLCLSKSNATFLLILHFRSINVFIGIDIYVILLPFPTSNFFVKMSCKIHTTFPSHLIIYLIIPTPFGVNMHSATYCPSCPYHGLPLFFKYSLQHSVPIIYSACSTAMKYHKMLILTQFTLSISLLSRYMNKLWSKFSTECVQ